MYRNRGLLSPKQGENGYFDYSQDDLQNLLYIRKLRGMNLPLGSIAYTYDHPDADDILADFQRECDSLDTQIEELRRRRFMLDVTKVHYRSYRENLGCAMPIDIPDDRYDLPFADGTEENVPDEWLENIGLFTQGLRLPEGLLRGGELPDRVPVQLTLGTYAPIMALRNVPVPPEALYLPRGSYLAVCVERRGDTLDARQLRPLVDYAREHSLVLTDDCTAFLFRVVQSPEGLCFAYRLRVRVENAAQ